MALRVKDVTRDEWDGLKGRLDVHGEEINRALARPAVIARIEEPSNATGLSHSKEELMTGLHPAWLSAVDGRGQVRHERGGNRQVAQRKRADLDHSKKE